MSLKRRYACTSNLHLLGAVVGIAFHTGRGITFIFLVCHYAMQTSSTIDATCLIMKVKDHPSNWHGYILYRKSLISHRKIKDGEMAALLLDCRLNHMTSKFSAGTRTVTSLKGFAKAFAKGLKQPHGGHQDVLRPHKQAVLPEGSVSEMEGGMRQHWSCSTCSALSTCLDSIARFILKQSF